MITERDTELKVMEYASKNNYTILANTLGALEYVKYDYENMKTAKFLKWPKGCNEVTIKTNNKITKIKITELVK